MPALRSSSGFLPRLYAALFWFILFSLLWILLTRGQGMIFGVIFALAATCTAILLQLQPWRIRLHRLPPALLFFLAALFQGAINVARCALQRHCDLHPVWVRYQFSNSDPTLQLLVSAIVGLLPGTVAARVDGNVMILHLLDKAMVWAPTVEAVERHVAQLIIIQESP